MRTDDPLEIASVAAIDAELAGRPGRGKASELLAEVEAVLDAVRGHAPISVPDIPTSTLLLRRRMLDRLRTALLGELDRRNAKDGRVILQWLGAVDRARADLDSNTHDHFAAGMGGQAAAQLMAELAHDLRSPLTSILTLSESLRMAQPVDSIERRQLGIVYSAALALLSVVSDAIELATGAERLNNTDPVPFSVSDVFEHIVDIVRPMAEERSLTLRIIPLDGDQRTGYPVALSRVLLNLTTNALKYTEDGFVEISAVSVEQEKVEFSVRDSGPGIEPDILPQLFKPFRRKANRKGLSFSGSGLGLTVCRRLLHAMDSELHVETRVGSGTRFYFTLDLPKAPPF